MESKPLDCLQEASQELDSFGQMVKKQVNILNISRCISDISLVFHRKCCQNDAPSAFVIHSRYLHNMLTIDQYINDIVDIIPKLRSINYLLHILLLLLPIADILVIFRPIYMIF